MSYHATDGLFFDRLPDGAVRIHRIGATPADSFDITIPDNLWGSAVLCMTVFGERPNDWHKFMDHHHGRADLMDFAKAYQHPPASTPPLPD